MPRLDRLPQINRNNLLTFPARIACEEAQPPNRRESRTGTPMSACAKRPNRPTDENRGQELRS